jgi:hypothetical protein
MPVPWPFSDFWLVMELSRPHSCDLYEITSPSLCHRLSKGDFLDEPEAHVSATIASVLGGCHRSGCQAVDLGANNGWMTALMVQMGARVIAVEPQPDLARAVNETMVVNCWDDRVRVINAKACALAPAAASSAALRSLRLGQYKSCMMPAPVVNCSLKGGWRLGHRAGQFRARLEYGDRSGQRCSKILQLPRTVGGVPLVDVLTAASRPSRKSASQQPPRPPRPIDLIKLDADGPEGGWLEEIDHLITIGNISVRSLIVEGERLLPAALHALTSHPARASAAADTPDITLSLPLAASFVRPAVFQRFQNVHGFTFYRLPSNDNRRYFDRDGWDLLSPPGTLARLDRLAHLRHGVDRRMSRCARASLAFTTPSSILSLVLTGDATRTARPQIRLTTPARCH